MSTSAAPPTAEARNLHRRGLDEQAASRLDADFQARAQIGLCWRGNVDFRDPTRCRR